MAGQFARVLDGSFVAVCVLPIAGWRAFLSWCATFDVLPVLGICTSSGSSAVYLDFRCGAWRH